eukprot:1194453-Prorocentrum_minimum.AAC.5
MQYMQYGFSALRCQGESVSSLLARAGGGVHDPGPRHQSAPARAARSAGGAHAMFARQLGRLCGAHEARRICDASVRVGGAGGGAGESGGGAEGHESPPQEHQLALAPHIAGDACKRHPPTPRAPHSSTAAMRKLSTTKNMKYVY